jgi:hypothetical protein
VSFASFAIFVIFVARRWICTCSPQCPRELNRDLRVAVSQPVISGHRGAPIGVVPGTLADMLAPVCMQLRRARG